MSRAAEVASSQPSDSGSGSARRENGQNGPQTSPGLPGADEEAHATAHRVTVPRMGYEMVIDDESTAPLPMGAAPLRTGGHVALGAHDPPELFAETSFGPRPASVTGIGHYNEADGELRVLAS